MKLTFLGTRGYIEPATRRHRRHTATLVAYWGRSVLIDCGEDWRGRVGDLRPRAIVVTHPHPDHVDGLRDGAPCPVYAIPEAWAVMDDFPVAADLRRELALHRPEEIEGITFEPFSVIHSTRAPAVGFRITAGRVTIFYVPDVVWIHERAAALQGAQVYVGDGATVTGDMVRKDREGRLIGHTPVRTQLSWCRDEGVPKMIVTHCGAEIVAGDERTVGARIRALARERGVRVEIAHDGLERVLRA